MNLPASIHVCSHSCSCNGEISTSHRREHCLIFTPTAHTHTHTRALQHACFSLIVLFFLGAPVSGWHHDHGCHASRSVFSKTAEDSLAHVTTASRLTCYHGDKPANENSADSCDVDYELFVLRGDLFFSPLPSLLHRPFYSLHVHSDVCVHKINMARLLIRACTKEAVKASLKCK